MNTFKTIIRILIVFAFLAPFVTCKHPLERIPKATSIPVDTSLHTTDSILLNNTAKVAIVNKLNDSIIVAKPSIWVKIVDKIISPTEDFISGIGFVFSPPDNIYEISLGLSFLLSVFLIFNWRFLKRKRIRFYLSILNLICISVFVFFCLYEDDWKILWGVWLLLFLIILEIILQYLSEKKSKNIV